MRVGVASPRDLTIGDRFGEVDHLRVRAGALDQLVDPLVDLAAGGDHELRAGDRRGVAGARLVVVGVGVRREDAVNLDSVARDVPRDVRDLGRRRDDLGAAAIVRGATPCQQAE